MASHLKRISQTNNPVNVPSERMGRSITSQASAPGTLRRRSQHDFSQQTHSPVLLGHGKRSQTSRSILPGQRTIQVQQTHAMPYGLKSITNQALRRAVRRLQALPQAGRVVVVLHPRQARRLRRVAQANQAHQARALRRVLRALRQARHPYRVALLQARAHRVRRALDQARRALRVLQANPRVQARPRVPRAQAQVRRSQARPHQARARVAQVQVRRPRRRAQARRRVPIRLTPPASSGSQRRRCATFGPKGPRPTPGK